MVCGVIAKDARAEIYILITLVIVQIKSPDSLMYDRVRPANRRRSIEPRRRLPRGSLCNQPSALTDVSGEVGYETIAYRLHVQNSTDPNVRERDRPAVRFVSRYCQCSLNSIDGEPEMSDVVCSDA